MSLDGFVKSSTFKCDPNLTARTWKDHLTRPCVARTSKAQENDSHLNTKVCEHKVLVHCVSSVLLSSNTSSSTSWLYAVFIQVRHPGHSTRGEWRAQAGVDCISPSRLALEGFALFVVLCPPNFSVDNLDCWQANTIRSLLSPCHGTRNWKGHPWSLSVVQELSTDVRWRP